MLASSFETPLARLLRMRKARLAMRLKLRHQFGDGLLHIGRHVAVIARSESDEAIQNRYISALDCFANARNGGSYPFGGISGCTISLNAGSASQCAAWAFNEG
jgi:hypothetical protein